MLIASLVLFGFICRDRMGVELLPNVDFPIVTITTVLEAASPEVAESEVTDILEDEIGTIEGVKHITSVNSQGVSQLIIEFQLETNIEIAAQDVRDKVALARRRLPKDVDPPIIGKLDVNARPIMWLSLSGTYAPQYLNQFADEIVKPRLQTIPGVGQMFMGGFRKREIKVWLDAKKLEAYQLTASDITTALATKNVEIPGGRIESDVRELTVKTMGEFPTIEAFNDLIITFREGAPIRLKDVGYAEDGMKDSRSTARFQGKTTIGMGVTPRSGANHLEVANRVKKSLAAIKKTLPTGVNIETAFDSSNFIKRSITDVQIDLLIGAMLASVVVFLFLRTITPTIIISLAIPTSLIGSFVFMYALGFTMNNMTMLALSLCVGLVVDDAIIVLENTFRHAEGGKDRVTAAKEGTKEIAFAATAATLSICAVFIPVAFVHGMIGRFFFQFGITVSAAVLLSLLVALTLTPMLCSRYLSVEKKHGKFYDRLERWYNLLEEGYRKTLALCLTHRMTVVIIATITFIISIGLWKAIGKELVAPEDQGNFMVRFETAVGSSIDFTDAMMKRCEEVARRMPEIDTIFSAAGGFQRQEANKGILFLELVDRSKRELNQQQIMAILRKELNKIPGIKAYVDEIGLVGSHGERTSPLQFDIKGFDLNKLGLISERVINDLKKVTGVVDVGSNMELTKPEVRVYIDRDKIGDLGVDIFSIAQTINTLIGGQEVSKYKEGGKSYDVRVRLIPDQRKIPEDIDRLLVRTQNGELIRLNNVVDVREEIGPNVINRKDRMRSVTIYGNLENKPLGEAVGDAQKIAGSVLPEGYTLTLAGSAEQMRESFLAIFFALALAVVITYMILASQFESFVHPFTIMLAVPLSMIGALGYLWVTGNTINIMSLIGIIMLTGLVVKNSILLVDYTILQRSQGVERNEAVLHAGKVRLRPILMTAITTIAGALPVALGIGAGGESRAPMGIAAAGGMTTSTLLTLFVVPVTYTLLDDFVSKLRRKKKGT